MKGICKKTRKRKFPTHEKALIRAGEIISSKSPLRNRPWRAYLCPFCNYYHLTTQPWKKDSRYTNRRTATSVTSITSARTSG